MTSPTDRHAIPATLLPGDGIGPEITDAVVDILHHLGAPFEWDSQVAGLAAIERDGDPLPAATLESIRRTGLALKGPLTTPIGGGFRSVNVRLRQEFELYANVRPARTLLPGGRFEGVDLVIMRENLEGLYAVEERFEARGDDPRAVAYSSGYNSRAECRRITEFAFDYAVRHGRQRVTIVHKANILKALSGLFLEEAREVAKAYEGMVAVDDRIVDACAMQMVMDPTQFDILVTTNLFGDILSDLAAGLTGGLGLAPGTNIGEDAAIFEAVHGSAPDIAGQSKANPCALLLASALMLDHVGRDDLATRLRDAVQTVLLEGTSLTPDLGGKASTRDIADAIKNKLSLSGSDRSSDRVATR